MIIASKGKYTLEKKTYVIEHTYTTHDICIRHGNCVIAMFVEDGYTSIDNRLVGSIKCEDDAADLSCLLEIGLKIMETEEVESGERRDGLIL